MHSVLVASVSDEFEIDTLLHTDDELSFRRPGVGADVLRKLRRGEWVIQDEIDLHGCRTDEARETAGSTLCETPVKRGLRCVRVVHGKGLGSKGRTAGAEGKDQSAGWRSVRTSSRSARRGPPKAAAARCVC